MIDRLVIIGVGLIGGSLGLALREAGWVGEIVGVGRSAENLRVAQERGIIDRFVHEPVDAELERADVVFLAVPPAAIPAVALAIRPHVGPRTIVTDGGSTKSSLCEAVCAAYESGNGAAFVPGHPIAGTEQTGAAAAFSSLYTGKHTILTPIESTPTWAVEKIQSMWEAVGARVERMSPAQHDRVFAGISHLPHAVAFALVETVRRLEEESGAPILRYAAGGFSDISRIASSDPVMWRDILLENRSAVLETLSRFESEIARVRRAIEAGDGEALTSYIGSAKTTRDTVVGAVPDARMVSGRSRNR